MAGSGHLTAPTSCRMPYSSYVLGMHAASLEVPREHRHSTDAGNVAPGG